MKALVPSLIVLFSLIFSKSSFGQIDTTKHTFNRAEKYVVEIEKPLYIDISSHISMYGFLGPESFMSYLKMNVIGNILGDQMESEIVVEVNDNDVNLINSYKSAALYIEIKPATSNIAQFSEQKVYRLVSILSQNEFNQHVGVRFMCRPILLEKENQTIIFKVKSKPVSIPVHSTSSILFNDTIHKELEIVYETFELVDSMAIVTYGERVKFLQRDYPFKNESDYYLIYAKKASLMDDFLLSKETIYEVISTVPYEE